MSYDAESSSGGYEPRIPADVEEAVAALTQQFLDEDITRLAAELPDTIPEYVEDMVADDDTVDVDDDDLTDEEIASLARFIEDYERMVQRAVDSIDWRKEATEVARRVEQHRDALAAGDADAIVKEARERVDEILYPTTPDPNDPDL
jgi:hypothetical protein